MWVRLSICVVVCVVFPVWAGEVPEDFESRGTWRIRQGETHVAEVLGLASKVKDPSSAPEAQAKLDELLGLKLTGLKWNDSMTVTATEANIVALSDSLQVTSNLSAKKLLIEAMGLSWKRTGADRTAPLSSEAAIPEELPLSLMKIANQEPALAPYVGSAMTRLNKSTWAILAKKGELPPRVATQASRKNSASKLVGSRPTQGGRVSSTRSGPKYLDSVLLAIEHNSALEIAEILKRPLSKLSWDGTENAQVIEDAITKIIALVSTVKAPVRRGVLVESLGLALHRHNAPTADRFTPGGKLFLDVQEVLAKIAATESETSLVQAADLALNRINRPYLTSRVVRAKPILETDSESSGAARSVVKRSRSVETSGLEYLKSVVSVVEEKSESEITLILENTPTKLQWDGSENPQVIEALLLKINDMVSKVESSTSRQALINALGVTLRKGFAPSGELFTPNGDLFIKIQQTLAEIARTERDSTLLAAADLGLNRLNRPYLASKHVQGKTAPSRLRSRGPRVDRANLAVEGSVPITEISVRDYLAFLQEIKLIGEMPNGNLFAKWASDFLQIDSNGAKMIVEPNDRIVDDLKWFMESLTDSDLVVRAAAAQGVAMLMKGRRPLSLDEKELVREMTEVLRENVSNPLRDVEVHSEPDVLAHIAHQDMVLSMRDLAATMRASADSSLIGLADEIASQADRLAKQNPMSARRLIPRGIEEDIRRNSTQALVSLKKPLVPQSVARRNRPPKPSDSEAPLENPSSLLGLLLHDTVQAAQAARSLGDYAFDPELIMTCSLEERDRRFDLLVRALEDADSAVSHELLKSFEKFIPNLLPELVPAWLKVPSVIHDALVGLGLSLDAEASRRASAIFDAIRPESAAPFAERLHEALNSSDKATRIRALDWVSGQTQKTRAYRIAGWLENSVDIQMVIARNLLDQDPDIQLRAADILHHRIGGRRIKPNRFWSKFFLNLIDGENRFLKAVGLSVLKDMEWRKHPSLQEDTPSHLFDAMENTSDMVLKTALAYTLGKATILDVGVIQDLTKYADGTKTGDPALRRWTGFAVMNSLGTIRGIRDTYPTTYREIAVSLANISKVQGDGPLSEGAKAATKEIAGSSRSGSAVNRFNDVLNQTSVVDPTHEFIINCNQGYAALNAR